MGSRGISRFWHPSLVAPRATGRALSISSPPGAEGGWHEYGIRKGSFPEHSGLSDTGLMRDSAAAEAFCHLL